MFLMSTLTLQILAIVGIILGLILLTFLYILTMYLIAKKQNITVEKIYQQTRPFQAERLELIKHGFDILDEKNYSTNESLRELYLEIDELYKLDVKSKRGYVKQSMDILFIYLIKVFKGLNVSSLEINSIYLDFSFCSLTFIIFSNCLI